MIVCMRIIGHLDMDAFFAAIEERNNPRFRGLPIVVGADPKNGHGRGVVSTANYPARKSGIHSAMPINEAWRLAPKAIFLNGSFATYRIVSEKIMAILQKHTPTMQKCGIDEAYFDLSHTSSPKQAETLCQKIKQAIKTHEGLTASIGIGPNKLIAKVASDYDKPDGLTVVAEKDAAAFLEPLSIRAIPGIGPKAEMRLRRYSIITVADMKKLTAKQLHGMFGVWGNAMYEKIRGRDNSPLREERTAKSIGHNQTFSQDTLSSSFLVPKLTETCNHVHGRLTSEGFTSFRTVTITVRFSDFQTQTRARTLPQASTSRTELSHVALRLFLPFLDHRENPQRKSLRLLGVCLAKLDSQ